MREVSTALAAHLGETATRLAYCWRLVRRDGVILGFTSHDQPLLIGGALYRANPSFKPSAIRASTGLSVDGLEIEGALSDSAISARDIEDGRYDGAKLDLFLTNWADPDAGLMWLAGGTLGDVSSADSGFSAELRGAAQPLQLNKTTVYSPECRARLGDAACQADLRPLTHLAAVTAIAGPFAIAFDAMRPEADWYAYGRLRWLTGANAGLDFDILSSSSGGLVLRDAPPHAALPGDKAELRAGCDKRFSTCKSRFSNQLNFQGEPHAPGPDQLARYPGLQ